MKEASLRDYNREAWNRQVLQGNQWTQPVAPEVVAAARRGEWSVVLTPLKPVPRAWFGELADEERRRYTDVGEPLCVAHSLEEQIGGQLDASFLLAGFYEDIYAPKEGLSQHLSGYCATRAVKPARSSDAGRVSPA